jgi:DNA polymerase III subunit epsilon
MKKEIQKLAQQITEQGAIVLDTEATGGGYWDEVFEIAVVRAQDGKVLFDQLFKPKRPIAYHSTLVHGYTTVDLKKYPSFKEMWSDLKPLLEGVPVLAFNSSFDSRVINQTCIRYKLDAPKTEWLCVMDMHKKYTGRKVNTSLLNACTEFGVIPGDHRAVTDALAAARVVWKMAKGHDINEKS